MKTAIMQPTFLPWIGYFDMIDKVDCFVFLDHVQLVKRSWQVRNRIIVSQQEKFFTVPVLKSKNRDSTFIYQAQINYSDNWNVKFIKTLEMSYKKTEFFVEVFSFLNSIFSKKIKYLGDFNILLIVEIANKIGINTNFYKSSELNNVGKKDTMLVNILKLKKSNSYLSAQGSSVYIEENSPGGEFKKNNIDLNYHSYNHPEYNQLNNDFISNMSIIDLLFNVGFENALDVIKKGRMDDINYLNYRKEFLKSNIN